MKNLLTIEINECDIGDSEFRRLGLIFWIVNFLNPFENLEIKSFNCNYKIKSIDTNSIFPWYRMASILIYDMLKRCPDGQFHKMEDGKCTLCGKKLNYKEH